jgi:hypothetical protein
MDVGDIGVSENIADDHCNHVLPSPFRIPEISLRDRPAVMVPPGNESVDVGFESPEDIVTDTERT